MILLLKNPNRKWNNFSNNNIRENCKEHPWTLELLGFYTLKFEKLDFTSWNFIWLAKLKLLLVTCIYGC